MNAYRLVIVLLGLVAGTACQLRPFLGESILLVYSPAGVCQKFSVATLNQQGFSLQTWPDLALVGPVDPQLPPLEVVTPQQPTTYTFGAGGYAESTVSMDVAFRCLPDKPVARVQFGVPISTPQKIRLRVTENASKPEGLEVVVEQFTR